MSAEDIEKASIPPVAYNDLTYDVFFKLSERQFSKMKHLLLQGELSNNQPIDNDINL